MQSSTVDLQEQMINQKHFLKPVNVSNSGNNIKKKDLEDTL